MSKGPGIVQRKMLLLLLGGVTLGFSRSPQKSRHIIGLVGKEWAKLNRDNLWRSIRALYESKLVYEKHNSDGSITLILSKQGRKRALVYKMDEMRVRPTAWDGKWRMVAFDIPEDKKKTRESMRFHLQKIGLKKYQRSIFICPYPCNDEIEFLVEFYQMRPFVRQIVAESIDNELHFKQKFGMP